MPPIRTTPSASVRRGGGLIVNGKAKSMLRFVTRRLGAARRLYRYGGRKAWRGATNTHQEIGALVAEVQGLPVLKIRHALARLAEG